MRREAGGRPPPRQTSKSGIPVEASNEEAPVREGLRPGVPTRLDTFCGTGSLVEDLKTPANLGFFFIKELILAACKTIQGCNFFNKQNKWI